MFKVDVQGDKLTILLDGRPVIVHSSAAPFVTVGKGAARFRVSGGHWRVSDRLAERTPLPKAQYDATRSSIRLSGGDFSLTFHISESDGNLVLTPQRSTSGLNRLWISFPARPDSCVYGGGAQYGGLDLRGHRLPLWVHEHRVGRESFRLPWLSSSGHHATFFPQPTFFTEDGVFVHIDSPVYGAMDFRSSKYHRVELWELPTAIVIGAEDSFPALMWRMSQRLGRQPVLPPWCTEGAWLEIAGGVSELIASLDRAVSAGVRIAAVCLRDWSGSRETKHGPLVFFDWVLNQELYPRLDKLIGELAQSGVRTLAYINPHFSIEGRLFAEASMRGYLVRKPEGGNYINDMGGLVVGHLDLTNDEACAWYKEIVKNNIFKLGFAGYQADMGHFLPARAVLHNGLSANRMHNRWPVLWAKLNRDAVREAGRVSDDCVFFTNTGYGGTCGQTMLSGTGEHNTSWGHEDGLPSALTAQLTLACSGMGLSFSDIGGNISVAARRSRELFLRWAEFAALTPIMRTSALPGQLGYDDNDETIASFARLTRIHAALSPYLQYCIKENADTGMPAMRPVFMAFPGEERLKRSYDAYMLGGELLVAPVLTRRKQWRRLYLPEGYWINLWSGQPFRGGEHRIEAPLGMPPVFYRPGGAHEELFASMKEGYPL